MLHDLYVQNLAVIAEAAVEFGTGLNVLTGETGAGKSIVVDSLALLSGARASSDLIRSGASGLAVIGVFRPAGDGWRGILSEAGIEAAGDELVVRREVSRENRNRVFLNDRPVTLALLSRVAPYLIRIHTQQEELGLVSPELQRAWLDRSGGAAAAAAREPVRTAFEIYSGLAERLARARGDERLRRERIDLLQFQAREIDAARLQPDEDERLRREREALRHSEAITTALGQAHGSLFEEDGAAVERISVAARALREVCVWEPRSEDWCGELERSAVTLEELARELRQRLDGVEADPGRLDAVEERLALIERLGRKYGASTTEVLEYRRRIGSELEELVGDVEQQDELARQVEEALERYRETATELSRRRAEWGEWLAESVQRDLKDLAMAKARFTVRLEARRREASPLRIEGVPVEFSAEGYDQVTYLLAANPGEESAPLARAASGGELSRVYLALQLASRGEGPAAGPTLVFDEVDAGIGGAQAAALGRKLRDLARGGQILAVTHLPQVASHADRHFRVRKRLAHGRTVTGVQPLDDPGHVEEVARMLAGKKVTPSSISHAEELIASSLGTVG